MKVSLSNLERMELNYLKRSPYPLWKFCPPESPQPWLHYYLAEELVMWVGSGYIITKAGRAALNQGGDDGRE